MDATMQKKLEPNDRLDVLGQTFRIELNFTVTDAGEGGECGNIFQLTSGDNNEVNPALKICPKISEAMMLYFDLKPIGFREMLFNEINFKFSESNFGKPNNVIIQQVVKDKLRLQVFVNGLRDFNEDESLPEMKNVDVWISDNIGSNRMSAKGTMHSLTITTPYEEPTLD